MGGELAKGVEGATVPTVPTAGIDPAGWAEYVGPAVIDPDAAIAGAKLGAEYGAKYGQGIVGDLGKDSPGGTLGSAAAVTETLRRAAEKAPPQKAMSLDELEERLKGMGLKEVKFKDLPAVGPGGSTEVIRRNGIKIENNAIVQPEKKNN